MSILEVQGLKKVYTTRFGGNQRGGAPQTSTFPWRRENMSPSWANPVPVKPRC